jgi:hypothetical protein
VQHNSMGSFYPVHNTTFVHFYGANDFTIHDYGLFICRDPGMVAWEWGRVGGSPYSHILYCLSVPGVCSIRSLPRAFIWLLFFPRKPFGGSTVYRNAHKNVFASFFSLSLRFHPKTGSYTWTFPPLVFMGGRLLKNFIEGLKIQKVFTFIYSILQRGERGMRVRYCLVPSLRGFYISPLSVDR